MKRLTLLGLLAVLGTTGESCADLPTLNAGQCGNSVVDPGEDCDSFPAAGCGKPESSNACHFNCTACPSGWVCDPKADRCREPLGTFESTAAVTFETTATRLELADFDGDGRQDLVAHGQAEAKGRETLRLFFFEETGSVAKSLTLGASAISPFVVDVDPLDGKRADLLFASLDSGINLMLGRTDRTLGAVAFPRFPFPPGSSARLVAVEGVELGWEVKVFRTVPALFGELAPGRNVVAIASEGDPQEDTLAVLDRPVEKMLFEPIAANIVDGPGRECQELIWVWRGENTVQWVETCGANNLLVRSKTAKPRTLLKVPEGAIFKAPVAVDLNGDKHIDLILEGEETRYVAFGRGDGTFSASQDLLASAPMSKLFCSVRHPKTGLSKPPFPCPSVLAAYSPPRKLLPNEQTLIAFPNMIFSPRTVTSVPDGSTLLDGFPVVIGSRDWSVARFDDLNANGYIDIVAASSDASDIDFFNGTATELFNPGRIRTEAAVAHLSSGDFDGDLVNDLAFVEIGAGGGNLDGISVAYGKLSGSPEPPLRLGVFPGIIQAQTAKAAGYDATSQLGIVYKGEGNTDLIGILEGSGDRQLLSPFALAGPDKGSLLRSSPWVLAAGDFDADGAVDVVALGTDILDGGGEGPLRPWFVKGQGGGRFKPPVFGEPITSFAIEQGGQLIAVARAADLDGDKRSEVVVLAPLGSTNGRPPTLSTYTSKGMALAASAPVVIPLPPGDNGLLGRLDLELADIDGDGKLDAVVGVRGKLRSFVIVAWGKGDGSFDVAGATLVKLNIEAPPRAFAVTQLDTDVARELLVATDDGTFAVKARGRAFTATKLLRGGDAIAVGDINGDGLPDVALSKNHRVAIYRGVSR